MTTILTLDLSTHIGWAAWPSGHSVAYGTYDLPQTGPDIGRMLRAYDDWWRHMAAVHKPTHLCFEAPFVGGPRMNNVTIYKLINLAGHTEYAAQASGVRYFQVAIPKWRKHFFGKGGGKRDEMKALAMRECTRRGWRPADDNQADALGMLDYAAHCLKVKTDWPRYGGSLLAGVA